MYATSEWSWETATDPEEVHLLLCASDAYQAARYGVAIPIRQQSTTDRLVRTGAVHLLRLGPETIGMFTLSRTPPFDDLSAFPPANNPAYLQRLAVRPEHLEDTSIAGARCLRKAIELAARRGADALRAEANPDLTATHTLLQLMGFSQYGEVHTDGVRRWIFLQKALQTTDR
ncbi:MAG: hypothetical protein ACRDTA_09730 [Pseudonocardiaceae bacterium]